jgi:DNA-binding CsgD family transcriptional regulator
MSINCIPQNHISLTSSDKVLKIASPLFNATGLNYFIYGHNIGNLAFTLHTSVPLFLSWFENKTPFSSYYLSDGVYFWYDTQSEKDIKEANALNFGNGIVIVKHHKTYSEVFGFNAPPEQKNMMSFYLNHMALLNRFCLYFKEQAQKMIQHAIHNPIVLPEYMVKNDHRPDDRISLKNVYDSFAIKKYYINEEFDGIKLSKREIQCLSLYFRGKTSAQISYDLHLSKSSIDNILSTAKKKFKCKTRSDLLELFWELGILKSNGWFDI